MAILPTGRAPLPASSLPVASLPSPARRLRHTSMPLPLPLPRLRPNKTPMKKPSTSPVTRGNNWVLCTNFCCKNSVFGLLVTPPQQIIDPAVFPSFCGLLLSLFQFPLCRLVTYSGQSFCALLLVLLYCPSSPITCQRFFGLLLSP
jgi:hypothetical protein